MAKRSKKNEDGKSSERIQQAKKLLRQNQRRLLDHPGVTSVGVGLRFKDGKPTDEVCIQCTVDRKMAPEALESAGRIALPEKIDGDDGISIPIDVIERNYRPSFEVQETPEPEAEDFHTARRSFRDPMVPGISVSHFRGTAGTIGAFVYDARTAEPLLLSNWHVLDGGGSPGDTILQPGPFDDPSTAGNNCGTLLRSHLGMAGDCAVARIAGREFDRSVLELNRVPRRMAEPELGDAVVKSGRTTGVTFGIVARVDVVARIDYGPGTGVQEVGGFEVRPNVDKPSANGEVSMGGDSGSPWMVDVPADDENADVIVGLHFAGETDPSPDAEHALACRITSVARKLSIAFEPPAEQLVGEGELWREVFDRLERLERASTESVAAPSCNCQASAPRTESAGQLESIAESGIPVHGRWCGPMHGGGQPVDALDESCMHHDNCYDDNGYLNCDCDQRLVAEVDRLIGSGQLSGSALAKAIAIRTYFTYSPCFRHIRVGGRTIPIPGRNSPVNAAVRNAGSAVGDAFGSLRRRFGF